MFRSMFDRAVEGIYRSTPAGRFEIVNPAFARICGFDSPEQVLREVTDIGRQLYVRPEDREFIRAELASTGEIRNREVEFRRFDGELIWTLFNAQAVRDAAGAIVAYEGTVLDITDRRQAEELLRKTEMNLNRAQAVAGVGSWYLNVRSHALEWSAETYRIFGIAEGTPMTHEAFMACVHPDDRDLLARSWEAATAGAPYDIEHRIVAQGELRWVRERAEMVSDAAGNIVGGIGTVQDVTDRKRAEEALRENEERYRMLVDNARDVILIAQEGLVTFMNPRMLEITGFTEDEIVGKSFTIFIHPDDRELVVDRHERRVGGEILPPIYEFRIVTKSGETRWVEINAIITEWQGKPATLNFLRDVTERKKAEEEIRESKALIDAVVENVPMMIFLKEAVDLRFVIFNRAGEEFLGYDRASLLGKNDMDLFPPDQAANFMAKDREVLDGGAGVVDIPEEPIQTARKGLRLLHTRKVCIRGGDGVTKYLLGISEDITDRRQAEDEIRKKLAEIEKLNRFMIGREQRVIELKHEVNDLLRKQGQPLRYGV